MQYLDGKSRVAKQIAEVLKACREDGQVYLEPFVGAGWVLVEMDGKREASDVNPYLIALYQELQKGWIPPDEVSEDMYRWARNGNGCPSYLKGFIGIAGSWGGKWFAGYARNRSGSNYFRSGKSSLLKLLPKLKDVSFSCQNYTDVRLDGQLVYCDPPYEDTTEYGFCGRFDSRLFWDTMREWSGKNTVIISGYKCPDDFATIFAVSTRTAMRSKDNWTIPRVERLFKYKGVR